ncbi:ATP-binding protein [Streptomyces violascens]|uniref:ATP-binding protein n=1 Tax=Streptomyces violascens TaxID=67381 RepID=UPI0036C7BA3F
MQTEHAFEVVFPPEKARVAQMRRITRAFLRLHGVQDSVAEDVVLPLSELVSNGVQHGNGEIVLRVRYAGSGLRIEVSDGNPVPAEMRVAPDDDVSGRGLFIVNALAQEWGVSDDGATTWCELSLAAC